MTYPNTTTTYTTKSAKMLITSADANNIAADITALKEDLVGAGAGTANGLKQSAASFYANWTADHNTDGSQKQINGASQALPITVKDNTTQALSVKEGSNTYIDVDTNNGSECVGLVGNDIIKPDQQLTTADFPNTTTLYIYNCDNAASGDFLDVGGNSKTLTLTGTLTAGADVLGVSRYNVFDGSNDYLSSTDAAFNFTGDFSLGGWFKASDWSPAASQDLISRLAITGVDDNGWRVVIPAASSKVSFITYSGNAVTSNQDAGYSFVDGTWHHIVVVRDSVNHFVYFYFDGALAGKTYDATDTITAAGVFEVGSSDGGNNKFAGAIDEIFVHNGTVLTADQVKNIYARSAKKFAVKDANGNIAIPELNISSGVYTPTLENTTNIAASTAYPCPWSRIGNVVTQGFYVAIDPTAAAATWTVLTFTLPIACSATPTCMGSAHSSTTDQGGRIYGASATTATYGFAANDDGNKIHQGVLQYVIN